MNQRGQAIMEAILILALLVSIGTLVSSQFRQNELIGAMVAQPWLRLSGMLQNGVWADPRQSAAYHPQQLARKVSTRGEEPGR